MQKGVVLVWVASTLILSAEVDPNSLDSIDDKVLTSAKKAKQYSESELKLMYQVFIYNSDFTSAKDVIQKALKIYPESSYLHEKRLEVARWTNDDSERLLALNYLSSRKESETLTLELIQLLIKMKDYEKAKPLVETFLQKHPTKKNLDTFVYVFIKSKKEEEAISLLYKLFLSHPSKTFFIERALQLSLDMKHKPWTKRLIAEMEKRHIDTQKSFALREFHYSQLKDSSSLYSTLKQRLKKTPISRCTDSQFLHQLSQLAWDNNAYDLAIKASYRSLALHDATSADYERVLFYGYKSPQFSKYALEVAMEGYRLSNKEYMLQSTLYKLFIHKEIEKAYALIEKIDHTPSFSKKLYQNTDYLILKLQILLARNKPKTVHQFFFSSSVLQHSEEGISMLLWYYINQRNIEELRYYLLYLNEKHIDSSLIWLPMASAYFMLQKIDKSKIYVLKLLEKEPNNIDFQLLYAYILQSEGKQDSFKSKFKTIYRELTLQKDKNPHLMKQSSFVAKYLSSAMYVVSATHFRQLLSEYKHVLTKESLNLILASWAMKNRSYERVSSLESKMQTIEPWLKLSVALNGGEDDKVQNLLYRYYYVLPLSDRVSAATKVNNFSMAYTLVYNGLEESRENVSLYQQFVELSQQRADNLIVQGGIRNRADSLFQRYLSLKGRNYLEHGYWISYFLEHQENHITNSSYLQNIQSQEDRVKVSFKKELKEGYWSLDIGYEDALEGYTFGSGRFFWKWSDVFASQFTLKYHAKAFETTYLLLAGYKNALSTELSYYLTPSIQFIMSAEYAKYLSQDDVDLGEGEHLLLLSRQYFRRGYPDISAAAFVEYGHYSETEGSRGVIDKIMPYEYKALPDNFMNVGVNVQYGLQNEVNYIRPWRPYGEVTTLYDTKNSNFSYALRAGIGGSFFTQGMLNIGVDYNQAVYGTNEKSYTFYLKYKLLY